MRTNLDEHTGLTASEYEALAGRLRREHAVLADELRGSLGAAAGGTERRAIERRVRALAAALQRLAAGSYGSCCLCGGAIEHARLAREPSSACCTRCGEDA